MNARNGVVVIDDGDVGGLLACGVVLNEGGRRARVFPDVGGGPDAPDRERAVRSHAELFGLELVPGAGVVRPGPEVAPGATRALVEAGLAAAAWGATRVISFVHHGGAGPGAPGDADAMARDADRALLVGRLVSLDGAEVRVETPLLDLSDVQLADLVADLDVPLEACWWSEVDGDQSERPALAQSCRDRWTRAMEAAGLGDLLVRAGG